MTGTIFAELGRGYHVWRLIFRGFAYAQLRY